MADGSPSAAPRNVADYLRLRPGHVTAGAMAIAPTIAALAPLGLAPLFATVTVLAVGLHLINGRGWPRSGRRTAALGCAFIGWAALTLIWTISPPETLRFVPRLAANLIGAVALVAVVRAMPNAERTLTEKWFVGGFVVGVTLFVVETTTNGVIATTLNWVILGTTREFQYGSLSRGAAFFAIFAFIAALVAMRRYGAKAAVLVLALAAAAVSGVHGYKALVGVAAGVVILATARVFGQRLPMLLSAALVLLISTAPLQIKIFDAAEGLWSDSTNASITHRVMIWRFVGERIAERPVQGWGLNSSRAIPGGHEGPQAGTEMLPLHPHNAALQLWLELGGVGALIAAFGLAVAAQSLCRRYSDRWELGLATGAIAAAATVGAIGYGVWQGWWLATIWLTAAGLAALTPTSSASTAAHAP